MPSQNEQNLLLALRMTLCENDLDALFKNTLINNELKQQLREIKKYYQRAFKKAKSDSAVQEVTEEYELLITTFKEISAGNITAQKAFETVDDITCNRNLDIVLHNIFKVCELLFWASLAVVSYMAFVSVGLPLVFLNPLIGFAITAATCAAAYQSITNFGDALDEFKSFERIENEEKRERNVIQFFSPKAKLEEAVCLQEEVEKLDAQFGINTL